MLSKQRGFCTVTFIERLNVYVMNICLCLVVMNECLCGGCLVTIVRARFWGGSLLIICHRQFWEQKITFSYYSEQASIDINHKKRKRRTRTSRISMVPLVTGSSLETNGGFNRMVRLCKKDLVTQIVTLYNHSGLKSTSEHQWLSQNLEADGNIP